MLSTITYAITVCNELDELKSLFKILDRERDKSDKILIQSDLENTSLDVIEFINDLLRPKHLIQHIQYPLNNDFASYKNNIFKYCDTDYIFQIDADEYPTSFLIQNLKHILNANDADVFRVPRINLVSGIESHHVQQWNWQINELGWINFPDYQWRIYKNSPHIRWTRKVHEYLVGYKTIVDLPPEENYCLYHVKSIDKQTMQNIKYSNIMKQ